MSDLKKFHSKLEAKINIQNDIDNFAIAFGFWLFYEVDLTDYNKDIKELLQIFKEQRR